MAVENSQKASVIGKRRQPEPRPPLLNVNGVLETGLDDHMKMEPSIGTNALARMGADSPAVRATGFAARADGSEYKEPDEVAAAVEQVLFEPKPKRRYMVVPDQDATERTIRKQIEQLAQLNEGQPYTYDRTALIANIHSYDAASPDAAEPFNCHSVA